MKKSDGVKFDAKAYLQKHKPYVTPRRLALLKQLTKKAWFQATDETVQDEIATLPQSGDENHDGFIENLIKRKSEIGDIAILSMIDLPRAYYTLCPIFEVQNKYTKRIYTYEYSAMRQGVPAGVKGIVLVRPDAQSEPTHMIFLTTEKFATARKTFDLMGGMPKYDKKADRVFESNEDNAIREIQEETGVRNLRVDEVHLLGNHSADSGISSHETNFYVAYIDAKEAEKISTHGKNLDDTEMNTFVLIKPLSDIVKLVQKSDNSLFIAAIAKAIVAGHIPKKYYAEMQHGAK